MAGLGRKVFNAGEVLSAANVQGYLQDQVVQVYSGTAARSSALGTAVSEGMMSYLTDSNELSVYTSNGTAAWSAVNLAQSENAIINGGFDFWQRGTSFSNPADSAYLADRFVINYDGTGATRTISQQAFTAGSAPVAGYESAYFMRHNQTVAGSGGTYQVIGQKIEDARTFAGQTATFSFWAKADAARTMTLQFHRNYGTGGSSTDFNILASAPSFSVTTSWTRFTATVSIPSVSGETIGTSSFLWMILNLPLNVVQTIDIWGVQLEAGSVATPFRRSSPTLQGEVLACQRYYERRNFSPSALGPIGTGVVVSGNTAAGTHVYTATSMRVAPTLTFSGTIRIYDGSTAPAVTSISSYGATFNGASVDFVASGGGMTNGRAATVIGPGSGTGYIEFSAEL